MFKQTSYSNCQKKESVRIFSNSFSMCQSVQALHKSDIPAVMRRGNISNSSRQFPCAHPFLFFPNLPEFKRQIQLLAESLITAATTKNYSLGLTHKTWQCRKPSRHRARQLELTGQVVHSFLGEPGISLTQQLNHKIILA